MTVIDPAVTLQVSENDKVLEPYRPPTSTNAAATAGNRSPAPRWNGSSRGPRARKTSTPGHSRPRPDKTRAR